VDFIKIQQNAPNLLVVRPLSIIVMHATTPALEAISEVLVKAGKYKACCPNLQANLPPAQSEIISVLHFMPQFVDTLDLVPAQLMTADVSLVQN